MIFDFFIQTMAAIPLLIGLWLTGNRRRSGPLLAAIAEIFTTIVGIEHATWSIILIGAVLFIVQGRNFLKWNSEGVPW